MQSILFWAILSACLFLTFVTLLIFGIAKKHKVLLLSATALFYLSIACGIGSGYLLVKKIIREAGHMQQGRSGIEIYSALFGKPNPNCVGIFHYRDQLIPRIDIAIFLHGTICADELKRILAQKPYKGNKISTDSLSAATVNETCDWFNPATLGDSIMLYTYTKNESGDMQMLYCSCDSSEMYCIDIAD